MSSGSGSGLASSAAIAARCSRCCVARRRTASRRSPRSSATRAIVSSSIRTSTAGISSSSFATRSFRRCARTRLATPRSRRWIRHGEARAHQLREHGAGLLPGRRRGRGGAGRPDRAEPDARRRRAGHGADLLDRVRARRRQAAPAATAVCRVGGRGRLDPARLARAARAGADRCGHAGVRDVRRADEGAAARGRPGAARGVRDRRVGGEAADRRRGTALGIRGPDAALRPGQTLARANRAADGVRGVGVPGAACGRLGRARGRARVIGSSRARRAGAARARGVATLRLSGRIPRALLREAPLPLRPARARRPIHVPRARARRRSPRDRAGAALRADDGSGGRVSVVASRTEEILDRVLSGERLTDDDAVELLRSRDLVAVGRAANEMRNRLHDPDHVTFIIDRNLNYTNVCVTDCDFCAFYRRPGDQREGYLLPKAVIFKKIEETLALGGTGLLMQGGHHPDLGVDYYEDLFSSIKARYPIHLHALSPSEIVHAARRSKVTVPEALVRMRDAGLDSIPGGGAEILVDRVRDIIAPKKLDTKGWLGVMREAHRLGISTTATMMYGHVETLEERVEHLRRIRELQDETGGFRALFSWTFQDDGNRLVSLVPADSRPTSFDYLLTQAVSRLYLDNVPHIGSSWVTQGKKIGQVALGFGADDLGSVMIEENVVSAAGTTHRTSADELAHLIRSIGKTPVQRDTLYRPVKVWT